MMLTLPELVYNFQEKQTKCFKPRTEKIFPLTQEWNFILRSPVAISIPSYN